MYQDQVKIPFFVLIMMVDQLNLSVSVLKLFFALASLREWSIAVKLSVCVSVCLCMCLSTKSAFYLLELQPWV